MTRDPIRALDVQLVFAVLLSVVLLGVCPSATAQDLELRTIFCPMVSEAPTIDGVVEEKEWEGSTSIDELTSHSSAADGSDAVKDTSARLMADSSTLYVAFVCGGPDGKPKLPKKKGRDELTITDNIVTVLIDLNHDHKTQVMFVAGYYGEQTDAANAGESGKGGADKSWDADWESAVHHGESSWSVEMAIPLSELSGAPIEPDTTVGVNLLRSRPDLATYSYLMTSPESRSRWYWAYSFADLVFGPPGVAATEFAFPTWRQGLNRVRVGLRNHGDSPETVDVRAKVSSRAGAEEWETKTVSLGPEEAGEVELAGHLIGDREHEFNVKVTRAGTDEQVYSAAYRQLNFGPEPLYFAPQGAADACGKVWDIETSGSVCFQPEPFSMELTPEVRVDEVLRVRTELTSRETGEIVASEEYGLRLGRSARVEADTSGLSDGQYGFQMTLSDDDGTEVLGAAYDFACIGEEFGGLKSKLAALSKTLEQGPYRGLVFEERAESLEFARSSYLFVEYLVEESEKQIEGAEIGTFRKSLAPVETFLEEAERRADALRAGDDPLAGRKGVIQRAFVSPYDRELYPYTVFVPSGYDGSRPCPVVVDMLYSGPTADWRLGGDEKRNPLWDDVLASLEKRGFMMVWAGPHRRMRAEANFFVVLDEVKKDYNIDADRVYLLGVSGGGLSAWLIGLHYPDQIAAICPISTLSVVSENTERSWVTSTDILKERSVYYFPMNALHVPVIILHGDADTSTLVDVQARPMVKKMRELGLEVEYVEYAGAGHGLGGDYPDGFERVMAFFEKHPNVRHPKTIDFTTPSLRYSKAYWIRLARFVDEDAWARVRAKADGNSVEIDTENVAAFTLLSDGEVFDLSSTVNVTVDGLDAYEGMLPATGGVGFVRSQAGVWEAK